MKRVSWKYLAGLIDGEGCIDLQGQTVEGRFYVRPRLRIGLANVGRPLLEMLHANFGGHLSNKANSQVNPQWSDATSWELNGYRQACPVLRNVANHLILKREQARLCLWMNEHVMGKRLCQKALNLLREELKLMKRDPHRLSESAQTAVWDAIVETVEIQ